MKPKAICLAFGQPVTNIRPYVLIHDLERDVFVVRRGITVFAETWEIQVAEAVFANLVAK